MIFWYFPLYFDICMWFSMKICDFEYPGILKVRNVVGYVPSRGVLSPKKSKQKNMRRMSKSSKSGRGFAGKLVKNTTPASKKRRQGILHTIHTIQPIQPIQTIQTKWCQQVRPGTYFYTRRGSGWREFTSKLLQKIIGRNMFSKKMGTMI